MAVVDLVVRAMVLSQEEEARLYQIPPLQLVKGVIEKAGLDYGRVLEAAIAGELIPVVREAIIDTAGSEPLRMAQERRVARLGREHADTVEHLLRAIHVTMLQVLAAVETMGVKLGAGKELAQTVVNTPVAVKDFRRPTARKSK